ncbi:MAG TPA: hypothetical protein VFR58_00860 [Flavisolibacter sp.]|nr:hypothetical protein [Flavisolibacter sp.]
MRKFFTGANYRQEWTVPVKMPVFRLEQSGLIIEEMGGGMQTKSLKLKDKEGREWALRSVDKFVKKAMPPALRNTLAQKIVQDMISAAHPYAAITVGDLAKAAGIIAPRPVLYFVPESEAFGPYREDFSNLVCFLEEREPGNWDKTEDTKDVLESEMEHQQNVVMQRSVLKARLLDMLVADWDRHHDQYEWGVRDSGKASFYYAIPRDRDQAFFMSGGLIPRLAKLFAMPHINSFTKNSKGLRNLNFKAWGMDKFFLNDLDAEEWQNTIREFTAALSDERIDAAVKEMPPEAYAISGPSIAARLKSRRDGLLKNGMKYYAFISAAVHITGTGEKEQFRISSEGDKVRVRVLRISRAGKPDLVVYDRLFDPADTRVLHLRGLDGDDEFIVDEKVRGKIRLNMYGDLGKDSYDLRGATRSTIYDLNSEESRMLHKGNARVVLSNPAF